MPGRHSTTKRPSRAGPILAAVVAVAVIVALGIYLAPRLTEPSDASGCDGGERISVATPRDLAPAIRAAVAAMPPSDSCLTMAVNTVYPDSSLSQINQSTSSSSTPTVWILDSETRLAGLSPEARDQVEAVGSAATTPIVLGVSLNARHTPPSTWGDAFDYRHFVLPDPASTAAGAFALAALSAESKGAALDPILEDVAARQARDDEFVPDTDVLIRDSRRKFGPTRWFPVTEQEYVTWRMRRVNWELAAVLPGSGTTALDYPVVARSESGPAWEAAKVLVEFLASSAGSSALGNAGFRAADGEVLNAASLAQDVKILAPPAKLDPLLTAWSDAQAAVS